MTNLPTTWSASRKPEVATTVCNTTASHRRIQRHEDTRRENALSPRSGEPALTRTDDSVLGALRIETPSGASQVDLAGYLDATAAERAADEANAWIKALRRLEVDGRTLRDRFRYRGASLWWFTELSLAKERIIAAAFRTLAALEALIERESPQSLELVSGDWVTRTIVAALAEQRSIPYTGPSAVRASTHRRGRDWVAGLSYLGETLQARLRPAVTPERDRCDLAVFVHSAFWQVPNDENGYSGSDVYIGSVIRELQRRLPEHRLQLVGIGPRVSYRARDRGGSSAPQRPALPFAQVEQYASWRSVWPSLRLWLRRHTMRHALLGSEAVRRAAVVRGCDLWPVVSEELSRVATQQLPWSARAMDDVGAAFDALQPRAVVTYAEAGAWGRALVLEGQRRGIPVVGIQHGFIYRHWLNYLHEPDEMRLSEDNPADRGFPLPDVTLVFDGYTAAHLECAGRFPDTTVKVTGSPALDRLAAAVARLTPDDLAAVRADAGARPDQQVVLVVTKFTEVGSVFPALVRAVATLPSVHTVVKCHPSETPKPYEDVAEGIPNMAVLRANHDLPSLLAAARLVITVNSTVAFDAMTLGIPALTVALPNNLSPLVDAGVMVGLAVPHPVLWTQVNATPPGVARAPRGPRSACGTRASRAARSCCTVHDEIHRGRQCVSGAGSGRRDAPVGPHRGEVSPIGDAETV